LEGILLLQKLVLRYYWPLLRSINLKKLGGFYSESGEDVLILSLLWNHLSRNKKMSIIEINKPETFPYSLTTAILALTSCSSVLINTSNSLVLSYSKEPTLLPQLSLNTNLKLINEFGCLNIYRDTSILYKYSSNEQLINSLHEISENHSLVILNFDDESVLMLDKLLINFRIFVIVILNNRSGIVSEGDMNVRYKLVRQGYVFHTRLNDNDDIFILTELINGFTSKMMNQIGAASLLRWVSEPTNRD